jgi:membrane fusion protein (multidrug efflux system)
VRLKLLPAAGQPQLRAGMSVVIEIDTGHSRSLPGLFHSAFAWIGGGK